MSVSKISSLSEHAISVHLDIPLGAKEAKIRGIGQGISRLVIEADSGVLAGIVFHTCPKNMTVFINAIGPFLSVDELSTTIKGNDIEIFPENELVSANNKESINIIFSKWSAEVLVAFMSDATTANSIVASLKELQPKWWKYSNEDYEAPYLHQLKLADPFFFYSPTLSSLEVLGSKTKVMNCFKHAEKIISSPG